MSGPKQPCIRWEVQIPTPDWPILWAKKVRPRTWPIMSGGRNTRSDSAGAAPVRWGYGPGGPHWQHLANTIEPFVCGDDAALCQITLTTRSHACR